MKYIIPLLFLGCFLSAQDVDERITVALRQVRVHVLDKDKNPVKGLKLDNFTISENGVAKKATFFEEIDFNNPDGRINQKGEVSPLPKRISILLLDTANMASEDYELAIQSAEKFIDGLAPHDLVKIVQLETSARDLSQFTNNKSELKTSLKRAEHVGQLKKNLHDLERGIAKELPKFAEFQAEVDTLKEQVANNPNSPDLKIKLTAAIADRDDKASQVDRTVREKERLKVNYYRNFYLNVKYLSRMMAPMEGPKSIFLVSGGVFLEFEGNFKGTADMPENLGRVLNGDKVTVYSMLMPTRKSSAESQLSSGSIPVNANTFRIIYSLRAEYSDKGSTESTQNTVLENEIQKETGLEKAATNTGGFFSRAQKGELAGTLAKAYDQAAHFYTLGYPIEAEEMAKKGTLEVKTADTSHSLVYGKDLGARAAYSDLKPDEQRISFKSELIFSSLERDDLSGEWNYYLFGDGSGGYRVAVSGQFEQVSEELLAYDFGFALLDENRVPLDYSFTSIPKVPSDEVLAFYDVLLARERPAYVRLAVKNLETDGFSIQEFQIPAREGPANEPYISSIALAPLGKVSTLPLHFLRDRSKAPTAEAAAKGKKAKKKKKKKKKGKKKGKPAEDPDSEPVAEKKLSRLDLDPFRIGKHSFMPSGSPYFIAPKEIDAFFHLSDYEGPKDKFQWSVLVLKENAPKANPVQLKLVTVEPGDGDRSLHFHGRFSAKGLDSGKYMIHIAMRDPDTKKEFIQTSEFEIE